MSQQLFVCIPRR